MLNLIHGDCLEVMKTIPDASIDAIITDPPYGTVKGMSLDGWNKNKTHWDIALDINLMFKECNRILKVNSPLILFSQEPYTSKLITNYHNNLPFAYKMIWLKDHFANALIAKKAPVSYFEDICMFFKSYDDSNLHPLRCYSKKIISFIDKTLKEINNDLGHRKAEHFFYVNSIQFELCTENVYKELINKYFIDKQPWFIEYKKLKEINVEYSRKFNLKNNSKFKSNVLEYKKDYEGLHPTQKPIKLIEDLVYTYTNKNDTVLDFTMGSGTTGVACKNLNRNFIGIELDEGYFKIAKDRIESHNVVEQKQESML